jgi:hypothetical protein
MAASCQDCELEQKALVSELLEERVKRIAPALTGNEQ